MSNSESLPRMGFPSGMGLPLNYFQNLELTVNREHLTGIKVAKDLSKPADFVFFHGAAKGNYSRIMTFAKPLVEKGNSIVAFDHSGHGTSTGEQAKSSLEKRNEEATAIINGFANGRPSTVCGSSMGGYTAIKMLEKFAVKNLLLFCPAIYDRNAYAIPFDSRFTEVITKKGSWQNTDTVEILNKFTGNLLVIIGSEDKVIPQGVIELIDKSSSHTKRKEITIIPEMSHAMYDWMLSHPEKAQEIGKKVAEFISA